MVEIRPKTPKIRSKLPKRAQIAPKVWFEVWSEQTGRTVKMVGPVWYQTYGRTRSMVGPPCWTRWSDQKYGWTRLMVGPEVWLALWLDVGPEVRSKYGQRYGWTRWSDQKYGRTRSMVSVIVGPGGWTRSEVGPEVWSDQKYGQRYGWTRWSDQKCGRTRSMVGPDLWSDQKYGWNRFIAPEKNMVGPLWRNHNYGQIWFNQGCLHNGRFFNYILCPKMFASPSLTIVGPIFFKFV